MHALFYQSNIIKFLVQSQLSFDLWIYIGMTYDNGDKTDSWCQSKALVPTVFTDPTVNQAGISHTERNAYVLNRGGFVKYPIDTRQVDNVLCMA
jgi:hypothetical protein